MSRTTRNGGTLPLFPAESVPERSEFYEKNKPRIQHLARQGVMFGSSSWKYTGWKGLVYARAYSSQKVFERDCIAEYAELFPTVCADFALYDFPRESAMRHIHDTTPEGFSISLKVTDRITIRKYPNIPRYGRLAGTDNPDFLNVELFEDFFLRPLEALGSRRGAIIFEFSTFHPESGVSSSRFIDLLGEFLSRLPHQHEYAVEIRNEEFQTEDYLAMLRSYHVAHVFNSWTRMPPLVDQMKAPGVMTASFAVVRALLKPGRTYQEAVQLFQPYDRVREVNGELREGVAEVVGRCLHDGRRLYVYVNNRAEGNSPRTIEAILDILDRYPVEKL